MQNRNLDAESIKAELRRKGASLCTVAAAMDPPVNVSTVSKVLHGKKSSRRVVRAIADALNLTPGTVHDAIARTRRIRHARAQTSDGRPRRGAPVVQIAER